VQLQRDRIILRDFRIEYVAEYRSYHGDPRYLEYYPPELLNPEHARKLVEMFIASAAAEPRRDFTLAIVERTTSRLIGCCSIRTVGQEAAHAELGVELSPDYWGRGFALEAARAMLELARDVLSCKAIGARTVSANTRIARLLTELGFEKRCERSGDDWMAARGWTHVEWSLEEPSKSSPSP
jgi:RimJ/RimL family protein N-acetyltransferase